MPRRQHETVGAAAPRGLEVELRRAFAPMLAQVRATMPRIRGARDAAALKAALRKAWPDSRIRKIVRAVMAKAEARASVGWGKWERKASIVAARDSVTQTSPIPGGRVLVRDAAEYDGEALIDKWSREAAAKITSVRDEVAEGMRRDVIAALGRGADPSELVTKWRREGVPVKFGTLEGRLKTIAQHQIANLHAQVQAARARAIGATEFRWATQEDDRVRAAHRALHGHVFSYKDPPDEGLPGEPVNCRCFAEVVIPEELTIPIGSAFDT